MGLVAIAMVSGSVQAEDITCRKDDAFRRIQLVVEDRQRGLPCVVVLWSTPTERRVLWRAEFQREFCTEKLQAIVQPLTDNQWLCQPTKPSSAKHQPAGRQPVM